MATPAEQLKAKLEYIKARQSVDNILNRLSPEEAHIEADAALCEYAIQTGAEHCVKIFQSIKKWYA